MNKLKPQGRNDNHNFDYSKVIDQIYIGSDLCKGMVCPVHSDEFNKLGVDVEINLSIEKKEIPPDEIDSYTWLPTVDGYSPSQSQLDIGTSIIDKAQKNAKTVYVHCRNGHGRSPTLVAAYLVRYQKMSLKEALNLINEKRPEVHIEKRQIAALKKYFQK